VLKDQAIDEPAALDLLASADLVVAHNARFDRPFVDRRLPAAAGKAWACTMAEVDWLALVSTGGRWPISSRNAGGSTKGTARRTTFWPCST
jgi:hypothetical protein